VTIEKGRPWGSEVARPHDLRIVGSDHELAEALERASPTAVAAGDMHRTLGEPVVGDRNALLALNVDLLEVTLEDGAARTAVAHIVARSPWWRGSWWRGPVLVVMNAEFIGGWDVAPRGHPNDGRVETQLADGRLRLRDRWTARGRLPQGGHIPHPDITTRSVRSASWTFDRALAVFVDGRYVARSRSIAIEVRPDAATIYS
jgi:hypothetical protein